MKKQSFTIEGKEMLQKDVASYDKQTSRVYVPNGWKKVVIVRVE